MKNVSKVVLALVIAFPFAASAKQPVDIAALRESGYQAVIATADQTPKMTLPSKVWSLTPASVLGLISFADSKNKADKVRAEYGVSDPAQDIASSLGREVSAALGIRSLEAPSGLESSFASVHFSLRNGKKLAAAYGSGMLVINVGTLYWFADTVGKDRYRVAYASKAQVVDTSTGSVLVSKECSAPLKKGDDVPQLSVMLVNDGESLKHELREAAQYCLGIFREGLFSGIAPPETPQLPAG